MLNQFLYNKKIPSIPPLLVNNKSISDFCVKANLCNDFFASICAQINNGNTLLQFAYKINVKINSFPVNQNDISLIIKTFNAKRAHDWDNISIKIIQICGDPILSLCLFCCYYYHLEREKISRLMEKIKCGSCS